MITMKKARAVYAARYTQTPAVKNEKGEVVTPRVRAGYGGAVPFRVWARECFRPSGDLSPKLAEVMGRAR